ncbi:hypothetical protein Tco_0417640 [Tanacetum coccineum]
MSTPLNNSQMQNDIMEAGLRERPPMLAPIEQETYANTTRESSKLIDAEAEAIHMILNGIGDDIYSTMDTCSTARKMWLAIEHLQQGELERISKKRTKNEAKTTKPDTEWKSVEKTKPKSEKSRKLIDAEAEAIHMTLNGIGDDIYSTMDTCSTARKMWLAIEHLQQGESINKQDIMNEMVRIKLKVDTMEVNVQFLQQLQPEWSRFVIIVKQQQDLDTISYHRFFDILKQHQNKVNEIRAEKIAKNANPLTLVAAAQHYLDTHYQALKTHKPYAPSSRQTPSIRSHAPTKNRGKEIA